jgi:alpha-1,2-mannosyltransferase
MLFRQAPFEGHYEGGGRRAWVVNDRGSLILGLILWVVWLASVLGPTWESVRDMMASGQASGALVEYANYIGRFWAGETIYVAGDLHGFHYLPATLVLGTPLTWMSFPAAGAVIGLLSALALGASVCYLAAVFNPRHWLPLAGIILGLSSMAAATSFDLLQFQILMTASLIAAAAASMKGRYRQMSLWLILGIAIKPLGIVMALLAAVVFPKSRIPLVVALALLLILPFSVRDWGYVATEYGNYLRQLWHITAVPPGNWFNQADFSVFLRHLGLDLNSTARLAIRMIAAAATLLLALRVASWRDPRATGFAIFILSVCYIAFFNPRQEQYSFLVVAPAVATIGALLMARNVLDWFGWVWLGLAIAIGLRLGQAGLWILPGIMVPIWACLIWLVWSRERWLALTKELPADRPEPDLAAAGA